jgi:methylated-DNA-[protein]-cysteine S-methyltransferase
MTAGASFALFETAVGDCALVWGETALVRGAYLPERTGAELRARILRRHTQADETEPPPAIARAVEDIRALFDGAPRDLAWVDIETPDASEFELKVYAVTRSIPPGRVLTYGEVAKRIGAPGAAREVGAALGRNPIPILVPCHRVVGADGKLVGFSGPGGLETKRRLLAIERARLGDEPDLFG